MKRILLGVAAALLLSLAALGYFLLRPLSPAPVPAEFQCYDLGQGAYVPLDAPSQAFGIGLSYAGHIEETASSFDPDAAPPVFVKSRTSLVRSGDKVPFPTPQVLIESADSLELGLGKTLRSDFPDLAPLLDYEVEMGLVLLEDIDPFTAVGGGATYSEVFVEPNSIVQHPITTGISFLSSLLYSSGVEAKAGTTVLASWSDGAPLVGYRTLSSGQRIVAVSLFPAAGQSVTGDVTALWNNTVGWAGEAGGPN